MATTVVTSMGSLVTAGVRAGRFPARLAPRRRALVVRAQSEPEMNPTEETSAKPKAKASPGLWDALAFSGPAPERINGRLAMVGFVSALAVEASRGDGLLSQAGSGSGLAWFAATAAVLSVASLVPLLQGESAEGRSGGFMSADAELWNGRFAMLGLVALAVTEYLTGVPFVNV
ncbi:low molecular mass early light-inducible protein HV90, chloroplastic-like [Phragmites australis]|uniref:low molecular mass early light-inducible protein HV90, chloroplastic-like n=1 Tax=Phragmites australis TaxID=29695 RepID=UPI002D779CCC|nr:low molecular mass early light-inducible protein HV90, chloroplastic-like [Phragmites australis]